MGNTYQDFKTRYEASINGVFAIARWFNRNGWQVRIPGMNLRPGNRPPEEYEDDGDLFISKGKGELRIEVKYSMHLNFTCKEDFPWPDFFIAEERPFERANGSVEAYFWVSKDMEYAALVRKSTSEHWQKSTRTLRHSGTTRNIHVCPLDYVEFRKLQENESEVSSNNEHGQRERSSSPSDDSGTQSVFVDPILGVLDGQRIHHVHASVQDNQ